MFGVKGGENMDPTQDRDSPEAVIRRYSDRCEIAAVAIFGEPGPGGPAGIEINHSDFARRKFFAWFKGKPP